MWTKAAGVDFGTCPALASFACRAPVVGEQFAPRSSRQASEPSELSLEHMHSHVFLTGCFKGSPELFDQVLQTLFRVLLLAALTVAFITGYSIWARTERASPHSASTKRLLDRSLPWLSRVKQLEKCSPWWAKVILGHHSPGRQQGMCALLVRGQRQVLVDLCWKAFVTVQGWQGGPLTEHLDSVAQHNSGAEEKPLQSTAPVLSVRGTPEPRVILTAPAEASTCHCPTPHPPPLTSRSCVFLRFWACSTAKCTLYP